FKRTIDPSRLTSHKNDFLKRIYVFLAITRCKSPVRRVPGRCPQQRSSDRTPQWAEVAVLVPIDEWRRLQSAARPSLKDWLLAPEPRFENIIPPRRKVRRRKPVE